MKSSFTFRLSTLFLVLGVCISGAGRANDLPQIAIIIDDLGNQRIAGERVIALPGPVTCSIMPHTAHATYLAERAYAAGKEVMLHFPMQSIAMEDDPGPGGVDIDTSRNKFSRIFEANLQDVPHVQGVNNHMGSLITRHPGHMEWLMDELLVRGDLFFVDSYTTASSIALSIARDKGVPAVRRDVFLDTEESELGIAGEFERLKKKARRNGYAIGIGHPYPETIEFLQEALPELEEQGFQLVPVSGIIETEQPSRSNKLADTS